LAEGERGEGGDETGDCERGVSGARIVGKGISDEYHYGRSEMDEGGRGASEKRIGGRRDSDWVYLGARGEGGGAGAQSTSAEGECDFAWGDGLFNECGEAKKLFRYGDLFDPLPVLHVFGYDRAV
jgi:hypothetical protein